ncbi:MAG: sulfatase [Planctomycetota bacterium]
MARSLKIVTLFAVGLVIAGVTHGSARASDRPNFVFILVDDLGWSDVSPNNPDTFYETPNIQRLAESGLRFTEAYAACQVCSPTRASILAGQYPARMNTTDYFGAPMGEQWNRPTKMLPAEYVDRLPLDQVTIAEALKQAGYATFFAGKWHLGPREGFYPRDQGFDVNIGGHHRGGPYTGNKYFSPYNNPKMTNGPKGEHLPDRLASEAVEFMRKHKDGPFLTYLSFYSVHTPLQGRKDLVEKYESKRARLKHHGPRWKPEGPRSARQVQDHAVYAAMVEAMDQAVGKVLDGLDELALADNTIVIFFSDNGGLSTSEGHPTSNLPLRGGKGWIYEGGVREPCIIRAPRITERGSVCEVPIISTDFYPTMLDLAGLPMRPRQHLDGVTIKPLLKNPAAALDRGAIYWHYPHYGNQGGFPSSAIRQGPWKLIHDIEDNAYELYNIAEDPGERHNLVESKQDLVNELKAKLDAWRKDVNARMPSPNPNYDQDKLKQNHRRRDRSARQGKYS